MKIIAIGLYHCKEGKDPTLVTQEVNSDFTIFQKKGAKEMAHFAGKICLKKCSVGKRETIFHGDHTAHCYIRSDELGGIIISDIKYPPRVAFLLLSNLMERFVTDVENWSFLLKSIDYIPLREALREHQEPKNVDKLAKVRQDLDETTQIMQKNIGAVLERGVKIDDLVERSEELSTMSRQFYREAKKANSSTCCCIC